MITNIKSNNIRIKRNTTPFISGNMRLVQTRFIGGASQGTHEWKQGGGVRGGGGCSSTVFLVD